MAAHLPPLDADALHRLIDALHIGVLVQGPQAEIRYVNPAALRLLGMTAEQLLGQSILDPAWSVIRTDGSVFPTDEFPAMQALRTGRGVGDVVMGVRHSTQQQRVWLYVRAEPSIGADGRVAEVTVTFTDITALREAEEARAVALRETERFRAALDEVPAYVYIKDREARYVYANAPTLRLFKVSAEELAGSPDSRFFPADTAARLREVDRRVIDGERTHEIISVRDPAGERVYLEVKTPLEVDPSTGLVPGLLGISIDITERRHLEEAYRTSQRLEAVGRLAGGVAHDFNNMLGVILGHAELALAEAPPGSAQRESLEEIYAAARRSADLTRQLLAFARKQDAKPVSLRVGTQVDAALRLLQRLVPEGVLLDHRSEAGDWEVRLDPSQLDQVLANLCVNAGDAIRSAQRRRPAGRDRADAIEIRTAQCQVSAALAQQHEVLPGDYVRLTVRDTGPGISDDVRERMFEPFFTTKPIGEGTGLGLATVFGVVSQAKGFITVDTQPEQGTAFHLHFPRQLGGTAAAPPDPEHATGTGGGGETVFVVEDEPRVLQLTVRALSALGYKVFSATDGDSALRLAEAHEGPIDLLLTDLRMPGLNGREIAEALEARRPGLRVLYMSGYTADILGGDAPSDERQLLTKPFTMQELAARVRERLGG